jgi:diguanylate cyclase (GGDEF)-like protein
MPERPARILLIVPDRRAARRLLSSGRAAEGVRVVPLAACLRERPRRGVAAAFVDIDAAGGSRMRVLRRRYPGAALVPVRIAVRPGAGRNGGRPRPGARRAPPILPLRPPVDPGLLVALAALHRRPAAAGRTGRGRAARAAGGRPTLSSLAAIVRATASDLDPQRIVEAAMGRVRNLLALGGWIYLQADADQRSLTVERGEGEGAAVPRGTRCGFGRGLAGQAALRRRPISSRPSPAARSRATPDATGAADRSGARLAVPLLSRGRVVGVVEAIGTPRGPRFGPSDARLLALLLEPVAVALDNALLLKRSEELSITDDLTKLTNSRYLNASLRREVERSRRYRTPVSLIFLDLDGFKDVNDRYGHLWGSRTLVEVGRVIAGTVREIDIVSRFGGDEFTVILPQTGPEGAVIIAERIRQRIAATPFLEEHGLSIRITASVGIASFPDHGRTKDDLIARADQAMYAVKGRGKDGVTLADPAVPRPVPLETAR